MDNSQLPGFELPTPCRRWSPAVLVLAVGVLGIGSLPGCAKTKAVSVPDGPPLSVPRPPERVLAPVEPPSPPVAAATPAPEPAAAPPPAPRTPPRPAPREADARPQPPPPPPAPQPGPAQGERDLRPAAAAGNAATERAVREVLVRANRDLGRVDYGKLSADGRAQYQQSKRFTEQAEQALKERNLVFAATLADKAATLAAELVGR